MALALPIDGAGGSPPGELAVLAGGAGAVFDDAVAMEALGRSVGAHSTASTP